MTPQAILDYWFADTRGEPARASERMAFWFKSDPAVDRAIAERFGDTLAAAADGSLAHWETDPHSALALVIALDQFPRNIHRATPRAFEHDREALAVTRHGVAAGYLRALTTLEQAFFLMPYQHCEDAACQREGVALFERMTEEAPGEWQSLAVGILRYARLHLEIIERFGRFPHRNAILGRASTAAEAAYLASGSETFGQAG